MICVPPIAWLRQVVIVHDVIVSAAMGPVLTNYQCMMRIGFSFGANQCTVLNVLVDVGAPSNLIWTGLVPEKVWRDTQIPLELRTVSHELLLGGSREMEAQLWFHGISGTG